MGAPAQIGPQPFPRDVKPGVPLPPSIRRAAAGITVLAIIGLAAAFYYRGLTKIPVITVVPIGQPEFQIAGAGNSGTMTRVVFPVAVTNHSHAPLLCWIGVQIGNSPGPGPWYAGREVLRLEPLSGTVTLAEYDKDNLFFHSGFLVADYIRAQRPVESKLRQLLHSLGLTKVATNGLWRSQIIGQVVQR
jgi:hypothetical protein